MGDNDNVFGRDRTTGEGRDWSKDLFPEPVARQLTDAEQKIVDLAEAASGYTKDLLIFLEHQYPNTLPVTSCSQERLSQLQGQQQIILEIKHILDNYNPQD